MLDNNKLTEPHLLKTHQVETMNRFSQSEEELFFAIQDSTTLNYTHHPKKKIAGKLHQKAGFLQPMKGFFLHNTLLLAQSGLPLGLLDQKIYQHSEKAADHKRRPIIEKESYRWIEALKNTNKLTQGKKVITLCDRESDIYEFFVEAKSLHAKVLVRAGKDRILVETNDKKRFTLMMAKLGGFLGRKNDKEPGMTYIWRGWEKLTEIAKFWLTLRGDD